MKGHGVLGVVVLAGMAVCAAYSCAANFGGTHDGRAIQAVESHGMRNVAITGHAWLECSDSDGVARKFTALNQNGRRVSGAVCCGYALKGCTVRW